MKISRNSPCPCGSGKKHKRCCGADIQPYSESSQSSLSEQLSEAIKASNVSTIDEANVIAQQIRAAHNSRPTREFLGLSPAQMTDVLYSPLDSPELVTFNEYWIPKNSIALKIFNALIGGIEKNGLKLTAAGNLPLKLCQNILAENPEELFFRPSRIRTETNFSELPKWLE